MLGSLIWFFVCVLLTGSLPGSIGDQICIATMDMPGTKKHIFIKFVRSPASTKEA